MTKGVPFLPGANTWWHEGEHGTIRISYSFVEADLRPIGKGKWPRRSILPLRS